MFIIICLHWAQSFVLRWCMGKVYDVAFSLVIFIGLHLFVFQVCGIVHSVPCTPIQCDVGALCPTQGIPACENGGKCVGALPQSKKADSDAKNVKERLDKLSGKITDAAEKVQTYFISSTDTSLLQIIAISYFIEIIPRLLSSFFEVII